MKINNIAYLLKEGLRSIFLHGFASFAAICVTVACLLIVGSFYSLIQNVSLMVDRLNATNQIMAYIDEELSEAEARSITTQINMIENVMEARFMTREEALENWIEKNNNDDVYAGLDADTFRHRVVVTLEDNRQMESTVKELENITGVAQIVAYYELAEGFSLIEEVLQLVSGTVIIALLVVSLLIISNTVKIAMYERRQEIGIMKMVGATNGFIRMPFIVEGFLLGMVGAGVAFVLEWLLYDAFIDRLYVMDTFGMFAFVPFQELLLPMVLFFGACGLFVGVVGSWFSIQKFMKV